VYRFVGDTPTNCDPPPPPPPPPSPGACAGRIVTGVPSADGSVIGTSDRDVILGDTRRNKVRSKGGNDVICGGAARDRINAGPGRDTIHAGPGADRCNGGPGKDRERSC
jgi:Ca2+-binding RTX toxin-like protein